MALAQLVPFFSPRGRDYKDRGTVLSREAGAPLEELGPETGSQRAVLASAFIPPVQVGSSSMSPSDLIPQLQMTDNVTQMDAIRLRLVTYKSQRTTVCR